MIRKSTLSEKLFMIGLFCISAIFVILAVTGAYNIFWGIPDRAEKTTKLEHQVVILQAKIAILEDYNAKQDTKYKLATRWSNLFEMFCDEDQKIRFDIVEEYVTKNQGLYKAVE